MVQKIVTFDVALKSTERQWVQKVPEVYTNDLGSVTIQFKVTDCTDVELTNSTAIVLLKMRDGSFFQGPSPDVGRTLNVFSYNLKENEGNHDGLAEIQLVVTIAGKKFGTQKYNFKVISGLDSEVAREIMIYDWSTLTAEARAYIDQFTADELLRDAEFDNAQFDRNVAFNAAQTQRVITFNSSEAARVNLFNSKETARAAGYDADHSRAETDHTGAVADRANATTDRTNAATDRTNAAADRTLAGTDHTTAAADHTQALANNATVAGFNARVTAEETATAANKISAVKAKTFVDVDARLEDLEMDGSFMGTNLVTNGNMSSGTTGYAAGGGTISAANNILTITGDGTFSQPYVNKGIGIGGVKKLYVRIKVKVKNALSTSIGIQIYNGATNSTPKIVYSPVENTLYDMSTVYASTFSGSPNICSLTGYPSNAIANGKSTEIQYLLALDLTNIFGAGNEPTAEQMDGILAKFENSWFDGTKNLFQAKASLNKLMALDARTEFEARNVVTNGDLSNGTTGWNANNSTLSANNNTLSTTGNNTSATVGAMQNYNKIIGNKYYVTANARVTNSDAKSITIYTGVTAAVLNIPIINTWYRLSGIFTATSYQAVVINNVYIDTATANGKTMDIKYITLIDLTATFGAGKEPTLAEMDRLMARFPNSWFDGVKPIQTIETLYQEKANKVQEAWITPTLYNGWTAETGYTVAYMKDEFGFVHVKGRLKGGVSASIAFNLPEGYRPIESKFFPCLTNGVLGYLTVNGSAAGVNSDCMYVPSTVSGYIVLDTICYKAER